MRHSSVLIAGLMLSGLAGELRASDDAKSPAYDQFVVIPLRVHVLQSKTLELANSQISDAELKKTVAKINDIWHVAGIHFGLESIIREEAAQVDRFQALVDLNNGQLENNNSYVYLLPNSTRAFDGLHVYIFANMTFNSLYVAGADAVLVKEKPGLKPVDGGSDHALSRVAARGLGSALSLSPRNDEFGLLSSSTNGIQLGPLEISRARLVAPSIPGALGVVDIARAAEAATAKGEVVKARRLWTWLGEIPGADLPAFKKRMEALPAEKP